MRRMHTVPPPTSYLFHPEMCHWQPEKAACDQKDCGGGQKTALQGCLGVTDWDALCEPHRKCWVY